MRLEDSDLADLTSLALKDRAFAVYEEMEEDDKTNFEKIAEALLTAFAEDPISAHVAFVDRKYVAGEGVDSYLNELKRLGRIAKASEVTVKFRFITGLPADVAERLRATPKIHDLQQSRVLEMARAMVQMKEASAVVVAAEEVEREVVADVKSGQKKGCFECGRDHFVRNCPEVENGVGQRTGRRWNTGGQRFGKNVAQTVGRSAKSQVSQWVFQPIPPVRVAIEDHSSGNKFGIVVGATVSPAPINQERHLKGVVIQTIKVNGKEYKGLIDTGCSRTVVSPKINVKPDEIVAHSKGKF